MQQILVVVGLGKSWAICSKHGSRSKTSTLFFITNNTLLENVTLHYSENLVI